jgi:hypothetical protein
MNLQAGRIPHCSRPWMQRALLRKVLNTVNVMKKKIIRMLKAVKKPLSQVEIHRKLLKTFLPSTNELIEYYLRYLSVLSRTTVDSFLAQNCHRN